jgi:hypothetical protein
MDQRIVEYAKLPNECYICKSFGHLAKNYIKKKDKIWSNKVKIDISLYPNKSCHNWEHSISKHSIKPLVYHKNKHRFQLETKENILAFVYL